MGSLSDYSELELLDHVFNAAYSPVATVYLALCTAEVVDADDGLAMDEATGTNYARVSIAFSAAASRKVIQNGIVTFPQAGAGGWGTISHWAVMDGDTEDADEVLAHGAFTAAKTVNDGNTPSIPDTEIYVEFSAGEISTFLAHKFLDLMFRNIAYAKPATYVALTTVVIADGDGGGDITEPSDGYLRKQVNINGGAAPDWNIASGTTPAFVDSSDPITFAQASGDWGTVVAVAVCDASGTGAGNVLFYDNTMTDQAVNNGDTAEFPANDLDIQMS